jgi:hypothetical protein
LGRGLVDGNEQVIKFQNTLKDLKNDFLSATAVMTGIIVLRVMRKVEDVMGKVEDICSSAKATSPRCALTRS